MAWRAVQNGVVPPMTQGRPVIERGHVLIEDQRIVAVGAGLAGRFAILDGKGILP